jgi:hypothetical protein
MTVTQPTSVRLVAKVRPESHVLRTRSKRGACRHCRTTRSAIFLATSNSGPTRTIMFGSRPCQRKRLKLSLGSSVSSFCYPGGKFNRNTVSMVEQAGFFGAGTCMLNLNDFPRNPFLWGVRTLAITTQWSRFATRCWRGICPELGTLSRRSKPRRIGCNIFWPQLRFVTAHGVISHLFLHSWEIDARQDWARLEAAFEAASKMRSLRKVTNGELFSLSTQQCVEERVPVS